MANKTGQNGERERNRALLIKKCDYKAVTPKLILMHFTLKSLVINLIYSKQFLCHEEIRTPDRPFMRQ